jgi:hypothetical protein
LPHSFIFMCHMYNLLFSLTQFLTVLLCFGAGNRGCHCHR